MANWKLEVTFEAENLSEAMDFAKNLPTDFLPWPENQGISTYKLKNLDGPQLVEIKVDEMVQVNGTEEWPPPVLGHEHIQGAR